MKKLDSKHLSIIVSFLFHSLIHWTFSYIFGETPVNILKLGGSVGKMNYTINLVSYLVITLAIFCLAALIVKNKIRWVIGVFIGTLTSTALNALVVSFLYYLMLRSLYGLRALLLLVIIYQ